MIHTTAHAHDGIVFVSGCTCGWISRERRATLQGTIWDELRHQRDSYEWPQVPAGFKDWGMSVEDEAE